MFADLHFCISIFLSFCMFVDVRSQNLVNVRCLVLSFADVRRLSQICIYVCISVFLHVRWCSLAESLLCSWFSRMFVNVSRSVFLHFYSAMFLIFAMILSESVGWVWAGITKRKKKRLSASDVPRCFWICQSPLESIRRGSLGRNR